VSNTAELQFTVNGSECTVTVEPLARLLDVLRDQLGLTGTKEGCGEGECGACTVLVDGVAVNSCIVPACQVRGRDVATIEGPGHEAIQEAFLHEGGAQCGICTPGMIMATRGYLDEACRSGVEPDESAVRTALAGNLCRCTGYQKIVAAVLSAARSGR